MATLGGKPLSNWRARLGAADASERRRAITEIEDMGKRAKRALPLLIDALKDTDPFVRETAARALDRMGSDAAPAVEALIEATCDSQAKVRKMAALALGEIGTDTERTVPAIMELLSDKIGYVRLYAAQALGKIGRPAAEAAPHIAQLLENARKQDAPSFTHPLGQLGPVSVPYLRKALTSKNPNVRYSAAHSLGQIGGEAKAAVSDLVKALDDDERTVRIFAAQSLGEIGASPQKCVRALLRLLKHEEEHEARRAAVESLGKFEASAAPAVPALVRMLDDESLCVFVVHTLGRIGPPAMRAVDSIKPLLDSKKRYIREAAREAIERIHGTHREAEQSVDDATLVDFVRTKNSIQHMLKEGLAQFVRDHADFDVGCLGLFAYGFGWPIVCLCIGSPERFEQGGDNLLYNLEFSEYDAQGFDWWPDLYEVGQDFKIRLTNGRIVRRSTDKDGDDAIFKPLFDLLQEVLRESYPFDGLRTAKSFRVGVEVGRFVRYWVPRAKRSS